MHQREFTVNFLKHPGSDSAIHAHLADKKLISVTCNDFQALYCQVSSYMANQLPST